MKSVAQVQSGWRDAVLSVLIGILCGVLFSILLLILFSILMVLQDMPAGAVQPFAFTAIAGGGFGGGLFAGRLFGHKGLALGGRRAFFTCCCFFSAARCWGRRLWAERSYSRWWSRCSRAPWAVS
ncbi:TIGR04086 family membrane protein [Ethanoligenens harbinense]|nr:TIGR04086 family membrane protein [Ethanoligenens harbinense YUAN-3]AYF38709.1 TIGR04086 family membrane protein [Ethanoligenens harbinense]